jgi:serine/threonine-protein kinase HipA
MNLTVRIEGRTVGTLSHDAASNRYAFVYAPEWVTHAERFALAPSVPLERTDTDELHSAAVRQFFENLLPEGTALDAAAQTYKVSKANTPALLVALGCEMAGAVSVHVEGVDPATLPELRRRLPMAELSERIRGRNVQPFAAWDGRVRLSVAGYQDKVAVLIDGDDWCFVDGGRLASTHLVKPEPVREELAGLTTNEYFCLELARSVGLPVAESRLVHVPEPVLVVKRFDRQFDAGGVARRHVIDGCQALGLPVALKYERAYGPGRDVAHLRDGASYPKLFALLQEHAARPLMERRALLVLAIFDVLIGNVDAHAKNVSFYASRAGLSLAPAYDLVSRHGFEAAIDTSYALAIGDAFSSEELAPLEWAQFARVAGFTPRLVAAELGRLADAVASTLPSVRDRVVADGGVAALLERLCAGVADECVRMRAMALEVRRVDPALLR